MIIDFSLLDPNERPLLILKNASDVPLGVLSNVMQVTPHIMYNEISELDFDIPAYADGVETPMYDDLVGMRIIELQGIGQFVLMNPKETGDGVTRKKQCTAYSLEYEFTRKKITVPKGTYKFYDEEDSESTLLGMLMNDMPSWKIGTVPASIRGKYRTFEVNNENRYNFMKGTAQKTYGCIFNFDTYTRTVYIDDASREPETTALYLSNNNLATEIDVEELTEDIVTRLDVNGAEGVSIRDVNPNGTNKIINLDHFMTLKNFQQELIDKYFAWKQVNADNRQAFYSLSIRHTLALERRVAAEARLTDLCGEMTSLENLQAVAIQAISQGLKTQSDLDEINVQITAKQAEISAQEQHIQLLRDNADTLLSELQTIRDACSYAKYFTTDEQMMLDRYIKDDEISDSSFVTTSTSYVPTADSSVVETIDLSVSGNSITRIESAGGSTILEIKDGKIRISDLLDASIISATAEHYPSDNTFVASFYLKDASYHSETYPQACLTITGSAEQINVNESEGVVGATVAGAMVYFSLNVSEYEKRSVAWDLYEYGEAMLDKLSRPAYTFSVQSTNFLVNEDYDTFRKALRLGERIYLELKEDHVIEPVCIGASFCYDDPESLELLFSDKYVSGERGNGLIDLLEQGVSMGKTLNASQYTYSQFEDSGASSAIAEFMTSALDVAKNALFSSTGNAVSWDGTGLRLRRWVDGSQTAYSPEQMWLVNNSLLLTADNWHTAQMGIGKFSDPNLGECWGIVAPTIVGTMLAGSKLVIESEKKDGGTAVFRVDSEGARLFNSNFAISDAKRCILLDPGVGMLIGPPNSYSKNEEGVYTVDADLVNFHVDDDGNVFLRGTITATDLKIGDQIGTDSQAGLVTISAGSILNLSAGDAVNIQGDGGITMSAKGGITLLAGQLALGSDANKITSDGVLSLASGNILLDGPNNAVTIGNANGTVNIGTDGTGLINLATYQVKSSTVSTSYTSKYSTGGTKADADISAEFEYTALDDKGNESDAKFTIETTYTSAVASTNDPPSITDGKLLQLVYQNRGLNIYADASEDEMILTPSVSNGHLMGWNLINAVSMVATNLSAATIVASSIYLPGEDGKLIAVADQKWTIEKIAEILKDDDILPAIKSKLNSAYWRAYSHSHKLTVGEDGSVSCGGVTNVSAATSTFNIADTAFYKSAVSAAKIEGAEQRWNSTSLYFPTGAQWYTYDSASNRYNLAIPIAYFDGSASPSGSKTGSGSFPATAAYNAGWNACRNACSPANVYTISEYAPGTLYVYTNGVYSSAGSSWVKVKAATAYNLPAAK